MKVFVADSLGMCFGVRDAVEMALNAPDRNNLTILGELVHNSEVLRRLRESGIRSADAVPSLAGRPRLGVVSQTTQALDFVLEVVDLIRRTFPEAEVRFRDTVCQPTKERQAAARRLASRCDVVIVVGGRNSNN